MWTPGHVVERDRVALHDTYPLPALHAPHPQGAIVTATEQAAAVRREGQTMHTSGMPVQRRPITALLDIPEPDRLVPLATGHCAPIGAPGHRPHPACVS